MKIWMWLFILISSCSPVYARGPGWSLSMPTFQDDGDNRVPFKVSVNSISPTPLPFTTDELQDRAVLIMNPSATYQLYIGTCSNFDNIDQYWAVPKGSGTFISNNHQTFWMKFPAGPTETVRGIMEKQ